MRLILVRHAESMHGKIQVVSSQAACPGLNEAGFRQSQRLAERLRASGEASDRWKDVSDSDSSAQNLTRSKGRT